MTRLAAAPLRIVRRSGDRRASSLDAMRSWADMSGSFDPVGGGRFLDRFAYALVGAATAHVTAHGLIDLRIRRTLVPHQQRRGGHDLPRLTIAALHHFL